MRKIAQLEQRRGSRVILLVHRRETMTIRMQAGGVEYLPALRPKQPTAPQWA